MKTFALACLLLFPMFSQAADFKKDTPLFAFGGVGIGGVPSKGETTFKKILEGPDSVSEFEKWFETGSDEARMYCLIAFYYLKRDQFDEAMKSDKWTGGQVSTAMGCIISETPRSNIVKNIKKGIYAIHIPESKWEHASEKK